MTDSQLRGEVITLFFAGYETMAHTELGASGARPTSAHTGAAASGLGCGAGRSAADSRRSGAGSSFAPDPRSNAPALPDFLDDCPCAPRRRRNWRLSPPSRIYHSRVSI